MLKRVVLINTKNYGKAVVRFDDCNSIQLVGPNNVGKSTLIYALNFLFIVDQKKMTFVDNKTGDKETLHHYFPSPLDSYIIFEIYKQSYYSILVKRNSDGELEYYKFDHEYEEDLFLRQENGKSRVLKFDDVIENLNARGIKLTHFRTRNEFFSFVYQRGKSSDGVISVENTVLSEGLSNNFSKVYRYLINSRLITNNTLKEALIVADNRDKEVLNFSQKSKTDILHLLRINDEIKAITAIRSEFYEFREVVNQFSSKSRILSELIYLFDALYPETMNKLEKEHLEKKQEYDQIKIELDEDLFRKRADFDRQIGTYNAELSQALEKQKEYQAQVDEIKSYEGLEFLEQMMASLESKRAEIESNIIRGQQYSAKELTKKIEDLKADIAKLQEQKTNYSEQLIHKLSLKQADKELLNAILSSDILGSSEVSIRKKITKVGRTMKIFDGEIQLPEEIAGKEIVSVEELAEKIATMTKDLKDYEKVLPSVINSEKSKKQLIEVKALIEEARVKVMKTKTLPDLEQKLEHQRDLFSAKTELKEKTEKALEKVKQEISKKSDQLPELADRRAQLGKRIEELKRQKTFVEEIPLEPVAAESKDGLNEIYRKIELINSERNQLKYNRDSLFDKLRFKIKSNLADMESFIQYVEDEIACLSDKRNSVETILQAISTQFANPAHTMIKRYIEFNDFIVNQFNFKLSRTKISDIESLKIVLKDNSRVIDDLKKISLIDQFTSQTSLEFDKTDNLQVLNKYLDTGKKIEFDELFDLELLITKGGKEKRVDLKAQVESTGTDIMIRLVIIMSVINRLAINDPTNKIAIAIDEIARVDGKNRLELFKFCNEHNFIPICTSTEETMLDGFEKYVMIFRPEKGGKVHINERYPHVILSENLVEQDDSF